jgi:hypothetical protein
MLGTRLSHAPHGIGSKHGTTPPILGNRKAKFTRRVFKPMRTFADIDNRPNGPVLVLDDKGTSGLGKKSYLEKN